MPPHSIVYMLDPKCWNIDFMSNFEVIQDFYNVVNTFCEDHARASQYLSPL